MVHIKGYLLFILITYNLLISYILATLSANYFKHNKILYVLLIYLLLILLINYYFYQVRLFLFLPFIPNN